MHRPLVFLALILLWVLNVTHAQKPELVVPVGHTEGVNAVAFSPNGLYALSGSTDKMVKLWEVSSGNLLRNLSGHTGWVTSVAFSPDGNLAVSASYDSTLILWDVNSGQIRHTFAGHKGFVSSVRFSSDGCYLLSGSQDKTIKLWEVETGTIIRSFLGHTKAINTLAFSPDNTFFVSGSTDSTLVLWNVNSGMSIRRYRNRKNGIDAVAYSPDGDFVVASAGRDSLIQWETTTGEVSRPFREKPQSSYALAFSPDGNYLLSGSSSLKLWDVKSKKVIQTFKEHQRSLKAVCFSTDGQHIMSGSQDMTIKFWDLNSGKSNRTIGNQSERLSNAKISHNGQYIASGSNNGTVKLWDTLDSRELLSFEGHKRPITSISFSLNDEFLLSGSRDSTFKIWEVKTGKLVHTVKEEISYVTSSVFSPDNCYVLTNSQNESLNLWNIESGKSIRKFKGDGDYVFSVDISADGKYILSGSFDNEIKLWDVKSGLLLRTFNDSSTSKDRSSFVTSVVFSSDGHYALSGSGDRNVKVWNVSTGELLHNLTGHTDLVNTVAFSPDNQYALSGSGDNMVKFWNVNTGALVKNFRGHTGAITSVGFLQNSSYIFSGSQDKTVKIWDIKTCKEIASLLEIDSTGWVVNTPMGLFDASQRMQKSMYYVVNDYDFLEQPWSKVDLEQIRQRYYQPRLLPVLLGKSQESLRQVPSLETISLAPVIQLSIKGDSLIVDLINRKGGIGTVSVFFNNTELIEDLRQDSQSESLASSLRLVLELGQFSNHFDTLNQIKVVAYNDGDWISSQPASISFRPDSRPRSARIDRTSSSIYKDVLATALRPVTAISRGVKTGAVAAESSNQNPPKFRAIVVGTSNVGLNFAHKDAEQVALSLSLVAGELFQPGNTTVTLLTTLDGTTQRATKADIIKVLTEAQQTRPQDVFVLYLSGHGVNYGGQDGNFYYLTAGATSADVDYLRDPAIREMYAISSLELTELLKLIPAQKKLMILDVCAAGKGAEQLVLTARDIPPSQIRALDRLQKRTGFYVLAGSTADAVSYESNVYGQGLLTYALLEGIRGTALRTDNGGADEFVDVERLLNYVVDAVPRLAAEIKGIQRPFYRTGTDQRSFDIGKVTSQIKQKIHLAQPKPVLCVSSFQEEEQFDDVLGVRLKVAGIFADISSQGFTAPLVYLDAKDYPGSYAIAGRYKLTGNSVKVICKLSQSGVSMGEFIVRGKSDKVNELAQQIVLLAQIKLKIKQSK